VLTGVGLALVPSLLPVELAPELVLLMVLPPVIYMSAVEAVLERLYRLSREGRFAAEVLEAIHAQYQDRLRVIQHGSDSDTAIESSARSTAKSSWG